MVDWPQKEHYTLEDLYTICTILRHPQTGCPWDKIQTHQSIRKNFLEETCEVLEAIDAEDPVLMQEELGDVLMQVALHTCMEAEQGHFTLSDVCREVCEKLISRHPHIFSSAEQAAGGLKSWDEIKNKEKGRRTLSDELDTVPATLPALMRAQKLQKRAAHYVSALSDAQLAERQLDEAYAALKDALHRPVQPKAPDALETAPAAEPEAGAFLLAACNVLRLAGVDAEQALALEARSFAARQKAE